MKNLTMSFQADFDAIEYMHEEISGFMRQLGYPDDSTDDAENPAYRAKLVISELGGNYIKRCRGKTIIAELHGDGNRTIIYLWVPQKYDFDPAAHGRAIADGIRDSTAIEVLESIQNKQAEEGHSEEGSHAGLGCHFATHYADAIRSGPMPGRENGWTEIRILIKKKRAQSLLPGSS